MKSILITGGAGFIGSCFVRRQLAHDCGQIVVLDKLTYAGSLENLAEVLDDSRLTFCQGDIADGHLVRQLLATHRPHGVVHFAAESHVDRSIDEPMAFVQTNVVGTCQLLEASLQYWSALPAEARNAFRFLHVSTDEVFGSLGETGAFHEHSPYAPNSPYAASKASGDHFARAYYRTYGLPTIISHGTNTYGPYQYPEKLIPTVIGRALGGQRVPVYGNGLQVRDWLHVEDHCRGLERILTRGTPGEVYLLGGGCEWTNLALAQTICDILDVLQPLPGGRQYAAQLAFVADRPGHDHRYAVDTRKAADCLDWRPRIDFAAGLREVVQWYVDHAAWVERVAPRSRAEDRQGMGLGWPGNRVAPG